MPAADRARVKRALAGLPVVAVDRHPEIEAPEVALPQYRRVLTEWMEVGP